MTRRRLFFSGLLLGMGGGREQASIDPLLRVWFLFFFLGRAGQDRAGHVLWGENCIGLAGSDTGLVYGA